MLKERLVKMKNTILRLPQVKQRTGLSRSTIYARIKAGQFKRPVNLGPRAVGWLESDIEEFINSCVSTSRSVQEKH
jgi:prophage regulatory protein